MKLVIAMMQHETNTFSPIMARYDDFGKGYGFNEPATDQAVIDTFVGTDMAIGAFLDTAIAQGAEIVTPIAAYAEPCGTVDQSAFERIAGAICDAVTMGCDAVLLDLHGAMVTEEHDDGEGALLARIRTVNGDVPIGVALDFHTNLTTKMVDNCTVMTGYCTYPHVDMYQTGERCAKTILRALDGQVRPRMTWGAVPILTAMTKQTPARAPMKPLMDAAMGAEARGAVLNASVFGGFPLADIPHVSLSTVIVTDEAGPDGTELRDQILTDAWGSRADFMSEEEPLSQTIARAKALTEGPVVIADHGDNSGAGGNADDMSVVREALAQGLENIAAGPIWDPQALEAMRAAGVGTEMNLAVGSKLDTPSLGLKSTPLTLQGTVKNITDGRFVLDGDMMAGFPVDLRGCAVLDTGAMEIIVSGARAEPYSAQFFTHAGIDPTRKKYVIIKSRQHFRAGFEAMAKHILLAQGKGVCLEKYSELPFKNLARPIYPFDANMAWAPSYSGVT